MACQPTDPCYKCPDCNDLIAPCTETCPVPVYTEINCLNPVDDKCVSVTIPDNTCLGIVKPIKLNTLLINLVNYLKNIFTNLTSNSLKITPSGGVCNSSATIELVPSSNLTNALVLGTDGKPFVRKINVVAGPCFSFVPTIINGAETFTQVTDWNCVASMICNLCGTPNAICGVPTNLTALN